MSEPIEPDEFITELDSLTTRFRSLHSSHHLQAERIAGLEQENAELHRMLNEVTKCLLTIQNASKQTLDVLNGTVIATSPLNGHRDPREASPSSAPEPAA